MVTPDNSFKDLPMPDARPVHVAKFLLFFVGIGDELKSQHGQPFGKVRILAPSNDDCLHDTHMQLVFFCAYFVFSDAGSMG